MELKINFDESKLQEEALRATILKGAVDHIVSKLTPEALTVFLQKTLAEALKGISSYQIQEAVKPYTAQVLAIYIEQPVVKAQIEAAAIAGVNLAIAEYPEALRKAIVSIAGKTFLDALSNKLRF